MTIFVPIISTCDTRPIGCPDVTLALEGPRIRRTMETNPGRRFGLLVTFVLFSFACFFGSANPLRGDDENIPPRRDYQAIAHELSRFIEAEIRQKRIPALSIALVDANEVVWAEGFGFQDPDSQQQPATARTIYRVGSVSKLLNDVAVMQLVGEGRLHLDADIRDVLPEFHPQNPFQTPITLRTLMNHQSGLVREPPVGNYFDSTQPSLLETVRSLNETTLISPPGSRTKYSNAAVAVAGLAASVATGEEYAHLLQSRLLNPLGMASSSFELPAVAREKLAQGMMWSYDGRRFTAPVFLLGTAPAGNLFSTVLDLGQFMKAIFGRGAIDGRRVIDEALLAEMLAESTTPDGQQRSYGIGFRIGSLDSHATFEHGGAVYGFATQFIGLKDEKLGVIVIASLDVANGFVNELSSRALRMMLSARKGQPVARLESTIAVDRDFARSVVGMYASGDVKCRLAERQGRLVLLGEPFQNEIRRIGDRYVIDDVQAFGGEVDFLKDGFVLGDRTWTRIDDPCPPDPPARWEGLIGEYGWDHNTLIIYEDGDRLWALIEWTFAYPLTEISRDRFAFPSHGLYHDEFLEFHRQEEGIADGVIAAEVHFPRRPSQAHGGAAFRIRPLLGPDRLREIAMAGTPPVQFAKSWGSDLVELTALDPTIKLDIRYATTNNFMGMAFYESPKAFMQRPAAEALVGAHRQLAEKGLGLLIHDAYRPWFVTKMFWEATPPELRHFVANPDHGSRHNRGCAVDLTLYRRADESVIPMVATYDEFAERSYPDYPGGTSAQRWHRQLLRSTMESAGFEVYEFEWWHFDYKSWDHYPILNQTFEMLERSPAKD